MKARFKKMAALGLVGAMAATTVLTGCGGSSSSSGDADKSYTFMISSSSTNATYDEYEDGPVQQYWMDMFGIDIDFSAPATGAETDYFNTMMATGEYADIMATAYLSDSVLALYDEGVVMDMTEYVEEYMPNYLALAEEMGITDMIYSNVDGEKKILQIYDINDATPQMWGGFEYRRDWILKYGTNPETGEAFTGGYTDDGNWEDDIVFPSGNTDPIYISDWEWMLDIFATALKEQGITDGYPMSLSYAGYIAMNDFTTGFGAGNTYYLDEDGVCQFGGTSDQFRAYIECMNTWYENGWIDQSFDERSSDVFFMIDAATTYSGKVGAFYGLESQMGSGMDASNGDESDPTYGICVWGAPQPINDVYGDDSCKGHEPTSYYAQDITNASWIFTNKLEGKDIESLLTAIDYLYTEEGGMLRLYGFSDVQTDELDVTMYKENGLDGAYSDYVNDEGVTMHLLTENYDNIDTTALRLPGRSPVATVDAGRTPFIEYSVNLWTKYSTTGNIPASVTAAFTAEQTENGDLIETDIRTYSSIEVANFVAGRRDISDDADWADFCENVNIYEPDVYCEYVNEILGK